ncbi:MAG: 6-phosphogluconolactonase (cycloisomerase 2 family) [Patescibacteria group bacterium]|jgi:6-phosphogluconolactonase (cycloisomerase 2 family)
MKYSTWCSMFVVLLFNFLSWTSISAQLQFESFLFEGYNSPFLDNASAVTVSPGEAQLYVSSYDDDAISLFNRDLNSGATEFVETYKNGINQVSGLDGISDVLVSPDGRHLYATGQDDDAIAVFERDQINGKLLFLYSAKNSNNGLTEYSGLNGVHKLKFTTDGNFLFAISSLSNTLTVFKRNVITGYLNIHQQFKDGEGGVNDMTYPVDLVQSPDEEYVYVISLGDNAITTFSREIATGNLNFENVTNQIPGLNIAKSIAISPKSRYLFVSDENEIFAFNNSANTASFNGLGGASSVTLSPDGKFIYVSGATDDAVAIFSCVVHENITATICEGDRYVFGNELLEVSGVYEHIVESAGCKTITALTLKVDPTNVEITKSICNGDTFEVAGVAHIYSGEYSYALLSSNGCDSIVKLTLAVLDQFPETVENARICEGENYNWNGMNYETNGQYETMLTTTYGCDSMVLLNLEVLPGIEENQFVTVCGPEFYVFGTSNYISSGEYSNTYSSFTGCDSTVLLNLFFVPDAYTQEATICEGDVFELGDQVLDSEGEYVVEVLLNNGCLVNVYLMLTVAPVVMSSTIAAICEGEEFLFNDILYNESGLYSAAFPIVIECDSMAYLDLTVFAVSKEITATICEGEEYLLGNETFLESGTYSLFFDSYNGCDSLVTLLLNVVVMEEEINESFCQGDVYSFGAETYTEGGTYVQAVLDSSGCETTYTLYLEQLSVLFADENIVADDGTGSGGITIVETEGGEAPYNYEWSTGEVGLSISNLFSGTYELTITDFNGCFSTFEYEVSNLTKVSALNDLIFKAQLLPNLIEQGGMVYLEIQTEKARRAELVLVDINGREQQLTWLDLNIGETHFTFEAPKDAGMYFLQLRSEGEVKALKLSVVN